MEEIGEGDFRFVYFRFVLRGGKCRRILKSFIREFCCISRRVVILRTESTDVEFYVMAEHLASCTLNFILVFEFLSRWSSSGRGVEAINLERSGTCAPSNRFFVV